MIPLTATAVAMMLKAAMMVGARTVERESTLKIVGRSVVPLSAQAVPAHCAPQHPKEHNTILDKT